MKEKRGLAATIGFFDGVHRGHRYLIKQVCEAAAMRSLQSAVITFPVHPRKVMQSAFAPQLLTTCEEKVALLKDSGIDQCLLLPFTTALSHLSAREFMKMLKETYDVKALVIGYDHRFGHNRSEGFDEYVRYGEELGMEVIAATAYPECEVSSSAIRRALLQGEIATATSLAGHEYALSGTVVGGHRVGRAIGFPTANVQVSDEGKLIPAEGVYAVQVIIQGKEHDGMLSIGRRPTLNNGNDRSIEVHIFNFYEEVYNQPITIRFIARTRDIMNFSSLDELTAQLHRDATEVKKALEAR